MTHQCVTVSWDSLAGLRSRLCEWLATQAPFAVRLVDEPGLSFSVAVAPSDTMISSASKPLFEVVYTAGRALNAAWAYIVDQSCVRIMLEELDALMTASGVPMPEHA